MRLTLALLLVFGTISANAQDFVKPLYEKDIPHAIENTTEEVHEMQDSIIRRISKVTVPTIAVYKAKVGSEPAPAILICPGGGYVILSYTYEGVYIAKWLNSMGITGIVLKNRLPDDTLMTDKEKVPLTDAQRAMEMIRENAAVWNIDPAKVGIMGFSAGGHLAATASTHFTKKNRPDFSVLIYPVITMDKTFTHKGSRTYLLGEHPSEELVHYYSNEEQITTNTPPAFLIHSTNDTSVSYLNSVRYHESLIHHDIRGSELHLFQNGGHGYDMGLSLPGNVSQWTKLLQGWLLQNNWIEEKK